MGVTETFTFDPGLVVVTLGGSGADRSEELARRSLTAAENEIVKDAILRFSSAGLLPLYENPNVCDGFQVSVELVGPGDRRGRVRVENVLVPEFNALINSVIPLIPPLPPSVLRLLPYSEPSP